MIEQQLEARVIDKLSSALSAVGIDGLQFVGVLQSSDELKALERGDDSEGLVVIRTSPRSYSSPTIPTCQIEIEVNAIIRADKDYNGKTYLEVNDAIMRTLQQWQRCYQDTHEDFTTDDFSCTGYQLGRGTFQFGATSKVWQYTHSMTVYGVVQFND